MKAQKKQVIIDYFDPSQCIQDNNFNFLVDWVKSFNQDFQEFFFLLDGNCLQVKTLEGTSYTVTSSDIIIRGVKGEYYPCKKDIFEQTYDKIN